MIAAIYERYARPELVFEKRYGWRFWRRLRIYFERAVIESAEDRYRIAFYAWGSPRKAFLREELTAAADLIEKLATANVRGLITMSTQGTGKKTSTS